MLHIVLAMALAAGPVPESQQADITAANTWLGLVDAGRWNDSWAGAGTLFKSQTSEHRWASTISPVRDPLGAVTSRLLKGITQSKSLPGAPDGDYEAVQFQTSFTKKAAATETVVLSREASGWKVDGYFIK